MNDDRSIRELLHYLVALTVAALLAGIFWWPLPTGGGIIGGDTYNYFFPLKDFYAAGLQEGELRLWHPGIGNGVPVLGESQTGALYPFNLLAYAWLDVNTAYSAVFLGHYVLAYLFTFGLGRTLAMGPGASHLVAIIYVYGWFPPRACLEWAIVTGAWLPAVLAFSLRWLATGSLRYAFLTALALAVQLYAGHFNLAWITVLAALMITLFAATTGVAFRTGLVRRAGLVSALVAGFLLAGPQLTSSWELAERSQRSGQDFKAELEEGLIPLPYLAQLVQPWETYADPDQFLADLGAKTNKVEAHLYFGLFPIALVVLGLIIGKTWRQGWLWLLMGLLFGWLATGFPIAWLADLPGFSFFRYCGRYGIVSQLAAAVLAGMCVQAFGASGNASWRWIINGSVFAATFIDLFIVGHLIQYMTIVEPPIIDTREASPVFESLSPIDRVLAPDGNTLALAGCACVPPYLGLGPAKYYEVWDALPNVFAGDVPYTAELETTLQRTGVTHLLTFEPLLDDWPVRRLWSGYDPFLHRRWARNPEEPIYLYRLESSWGRAYVVTQDDERQEATVEFQEFAPTKIVLEVTSPTDGQLVLTDLDFPGWSVAVDDVAVDVESAPPFCRSVHVSAGRHRVVWTYSPRSLYIGLAIALATLVAATALLIHRGGRV